MAWIIMLAHCSKCGSSIPYFHGEQKEGDSFLDPAKCPFCGETFEGVATTNYDNTTRTWTHDSDYLIKRTNEHELEV